MKIKQSMMGVVAGFGAVGLIASGCSGVAEDAERTLSVSVTVAQDHLLSVAYREWADQITEATNGELQFSFQYDSSLCSAADTAECIGSGRADVGQSGPSWDPAAFPLTGVADTGFIEPDVAAATKAANKMVEEYPEIPAEYEAQGQELMFLAALDPLVITTAEKLETFDDLNQLNLRATGIYPEILAPLGVSSINVPLAEQYESVQRGVIDGVVSLIDTSLMLSMEEVAPHNAAIGQYVGPTSQTALGMNKAVYDGLSESQRAAVDAANANMVEIWYPDFQKPMSIETCELLDESGATVNTIGTPEEAEAWINEVRGPADEAWIAEASAHVDDPAAMLDRYRELVTEYSTDAGDGAVNGVEECLN